MIDAKPLTYAEEHEIRDLHHGSTDYTVRGLLATIDDLRAKIATAEARTEKALAVLSALVADVAQECSVPRGTVGPAESLANSEEETCGRPARWGILTAWTCDEHRRPRDKSAIGSAPLIAALDLLAERGAAAQPAGAGPRRARQGPR